MQKIKFAAKMLQVANFFNKNQIDTNELLEKTKLALRKLPIFRDEEELRTIEKMMGRLEYFQKVKKSYGFQIFREMCNNLDFKSFPINSEVIQIYQPGTTFYVILKGSVSVRVYLPKKKDDDEEQKETSSFKNKADDTPNYLKLNQDQFETQEVNILRVGQSFGELALLESTQKTTAQIVTVEDCEFACLDRKQFQAILGTIKRKEIKEKLDFLKAIPFLSGWFENDIKTLSYHFEISTMQRHSFVYKEKQKTGKVYLVKSGEIELIKQYKKKIQRDKSKGKDLSGLKTMIKELKETRYITVCKINPGEIFGEESLLDYEQRQYSAMVILNDTEIYEISKSDLNRRVWQKESRTVLNDLIQQKWIWRLERAKQQLKMEGQDQNELDSMKVIDHLQKLKEFLLPDLIFQPPPPPQNEPTPNKLKQLQQFYQENKGKHVSAGSNLLLEVMDVQQTYKQYQSAKCKKNDKSSNNSLNTLQPTQSNRSKFKTLHIDKQILQKMQNKKRQPLSQSQVFQRPQINKQIYLTSKIPSLQQNESTKDFMTVEQKMENLFSKLNIQNTLDNQDDFEVQLASFGQLYKNLNKNNIEEISRKAKILEEEFAAINKNQDIAVGKNIEIPHESDNKIRLQYFIRNLKKFQKRLKVLKQVRQGLIQCDTNQFVNDDGEIQSIKEEENFQFNFITQRDFHKEIKSESQQLLKRTSHVDYMISDIVNKIQTMKKQQSDERKSSETPRLEGVRRKSSVYLNKVEETPNETHMVDSSITQNSKQFEDSRVKRFVRRSSKLSSGSLLDTRAIVVEKYSQIKKNLIMSQYKTSFQTQNTGQTSTGRNTKYSSNYELTQQQDTMSFKRVFNFS